MIDLELYGGRRGVLEHIRARTLYALGAYGSTGDIEWSSVKRLVFVCFGNICRSPYAAGRARLLGVSSISLGLNANDGASADPAAMRNALLRGIDLSAHRSARIDSPNLVDGDLILAFEPGQLFEIRRKFGDRAPVKLVGVWSRPSRPYIHDPYGRDDRYFQQCFSVIDRNVTKLVECMRSRRAPAINGSFV